MAMVVAYTFLAFGMLRWHFSYGPPYHQTTVGLLVVFAVAAALVGLLSVWATLGMLHWAKRASAAIVAVSVMTGLWLLFFEWNQFLIWQMVVLLVVQIACLVVVLGICRIAGLAMRHDQSEKQSPDKGLQVTIRDLLILTASFGLLCAVLNTGHPVELGATVYGILLAGGVCAACTALAALWISFSKSSVVLRASVFVMVAPLGGVVYIIASQYAQLLFSWRWYACVTSLQMLLLVVPFGVVRACGISIARIEVGASNVL